MDAMMLAVACSFGREGRRAPRDIVMAFVADEEDTGEYGAGFLVDKHPELFEGVGSAISESGAFSVPLPDGSLLYPIAAAERGSAWMTLTATGTAGHGSRANPDNAVTALVRAVDRLAAITWPQHLTPPVEALIDGLAEHLGHPIDLTSLSGLGRVGDMIAATLSNSLNPTMLSAGYKHNVIPSSATAGVDGRILPGTEEAFFAAVDAALGDSVTREFASFSAPVSADHASPEFAAMADAIRAHDPDALVLPFCMSGGTDAKAFARLGIPGYGFTPGRTPAEFQLWNYVHGVDERVLVDSLTFGVRVLDTYLRAAPGA
jgi:acetylornithine deacetylase/succinyl-diaminopimelate desuccinylase-like protein